MKKLLFFFFAGWLGVLSAQNKDPQNSLSIAAGPNWYILLDRGVENYTYTAQTGLGGGLDYTHRIDGHWQVKVSLRYNTLRQTAESGWLRWPSEYGPDGSYTPDPSLPHYITVRTTDRVWQYTAGIRWLGKPKTWRFYADADAGLVDYIEQEGQSKSPWKVIAGLAVGLAWQPAGSQMAWFVQPGVRYLFRNLASDRTPYVYQFLIPAAEVGACYHF